MPELVTIDSILEWFKTSAETKVPIGAGQWINAAMRLNVLASDMDDEIASYEHKMAEAECKYLEEGKTASYAHKMRIMAIPYEDYLRLVAKKKRVLEFLRLSKKQGEVESFSKYA